MATKFKRAGVGKLNEKLFSYMATNNTLEYSQLSFLF
jgi:hypothetical protein